MVVLRRRPLEHQRPNGAWVCGCVGQIDSNLWPDGQSGKSTFQLTPKFQLIGFWTRETQYFPDHFGSSTVPFASTRNFTEDSYETKGEIQGTINTHLLIDAFAGHHEYVATYNSQPSAAKIPSIADLTTGFQNGVGSKNPTEGF